MLECWRFGNDELRGWCLGLHLEPLCLGHVFLLRDYDVDILKPSDFGELLLSVFVCSMPWRDAERMLKRRWRLSLFLAYWGWRVRKHQFQETLTQFKGYIDRNLSHPEFVIGEHSRDCASPLPFRLLGIALRMLNMDWDRAHDIPIRTLMSVWCAAAEMRGEIELWGDRHEEFWNWAREQDESKRKAANGSAETTVQA